MPPELMFYAALAALTFVIVAAHVLSQRRWRERVRPGINELLTREHCRWCGSPTLAWDGRFGAIDVDVDPGPSPLAEVSFRCQTCGRTTAHEVYPNGSTRCDDGPDRRPVVRKCRKCYYVFEGTSKDACSQCTSHDHAESLPSQVGP